MAKRKLDVANIANTSKKQKNNTDINLEEDVIKYYLMPSLQHVSMSNIIITLWNKTDIKYQIVKISNEYELFNDIHRLYFDIEDKVLDKVLQLPVPDCIRKILSNIVHPIGCQIFDWIEYQDRYIFNIGYNNRNSKSIAINYIDYLVWTARGVIDYKETAKTLLTKEEKLLDDYKFNMACSYCLEDNIAIIAPKVINATLNLSCFKNQAQAMVYFWTAHITGDFTELDQAVYFYNRICSTNYSIDEYLFKELIDDDCTNQVAIKYIWDKLSNEAKSRQIVSAIKKTSNIDIRCFLLSQISKEQEKEVFETHDATSILLDFLDDWLWGQYFLPTIHHIWDIISGCDYLHVLKGIVHKMERNHEDTEKYNQYKSIFKELWQYAPKHLKEYVFEHENDHNNHSIFLSLFHKKNIDIIQSILCDSNDIQKKKIFSNYVVDICHSLITSNQWDLLEMCIGHTLFSREVVECFKQRLIKEKGREIAVHFIQNKEWNKVEQFLQWAFKSDDEIKEFKSKLAYTKICNDILESIVTNNKVDFTELEHFFKWCASGNAEGVVELKIEVPQLYFDEVICNLIEEDKYELLEQILNWCFVNDQKQIAQFKQNFYYEHGNFEIVRLVVHLIKQDDQLQSFKKFVYYWCSTDEEINKFKTCILYPAEDTLGVCMELLRKDKFKLADEFVGWCCNSSQRQIDNFKNQLMIDDGMECLSEGDDPRTFYETGLIKWFNPSLETITRFKEKFINFCWLKDILPVLDNSIKEQEYNQDKAINKDVNNILQDLISAVEKQDHDIIHCNDDVTVCLTGVITEDASVIL